MSESARRVLVAAPRGYCAGVDRAVVAVERALELYGPPVYVRKEIVHNRPTRRRTTSATPRRTARSRSRPWPPGATRWWSSNSSNSLRLVEVAREAGAHAYRVDTAEEVDPAWLDGATTVGVTSGASVPDVLVTELLDVLAGHGYTDVDEVRTTTESLRFTLPHELRDARPAP